MPPELAWFEPLFSRDRSYAWGIDPDQHGAVLPNAPGHASGVLSVRGGARYAVWVQGDFPRRTDVSLDGRAIGSVVGSNTPGQWLQVTSLPLSAGRHTLTVTRPAGTRSHAGPGEAGIGVIGAVALQRERAERLVTLSLGRWRTLCDTKLDWVEARTTVSPGSQTAPSGAPDRRRRRRGPTPVRIVLAVGLFAIVAVAVIVLSQSGERRSGSNLTGDLGFVLPLAAGQHLCEPGELLPGDTGALRLAASAGAAPGPRLAVSIGGPRGPVSSGGLSAGWRSGPVLIPVTRVAHTTPGATVCVQNLGTSPVVFGGSVPDGSFVVQLDGRGLGGRMRIEYMRPGRETWLQLLPTLANRFSLAKSDLVRHWAAGAALVLVLLALALAALTLIIEEPAP